MGRLTHDLAEEREGVASSDFSEMRIPKKPSLCASGKCRKSLGHIVQVMDGVVQEVAPKRFDGEARTVGARPGPLPLVVAHAVEGGGELPSCHYQGLAHRRWVILPVALRY